MRTCVGSMVVAVLCSALSAADFKAKPTVTRDGDKAVIAFAVDGPTDVAVSIVNGEGKTVRHLAGGAIGAVTAAAPLKDGELAQSLVWDGADDAGRVVPPGVYKAVVQLGLGVAADRVIGDDRQSIGAVSAMVVGPKGELYVVDSGQINVFDREGTYVRQVLPTPAGLTKAQLAGLDPVELPDGSLFPRRGLPGVGGCTGSIAISPDGRTLYLPGPPRYARGLVKLGTDGSVPPDALGTRLTTHADNGNLFLAVSPDGKTLYMAGAEAGYQGDDARVLSYRQSIYRLRLDSTLPAEIFTGDDENAGEGFSVCKPKGLAVDPAGRLYVCNYGTGCVAMYTPRAGFLKSFKVPHAQQVAVNPKTGQLYVLAGPESGVFKYGFQYPETMHSAKVVQLSPEGVIEKELVLDPPFSKTRRDPKTGVPTTQAEFNVRMAVDFSDPAKPIIWLGLAHPAISYSAWGLLRIEDLGDRFGRPRDVCSHDRDTVRGSMGRMSLDVDRGILYLNGGNKFSRYNAADGSPMDAVRLTGPASTQAAKIQVMEQGVGPNGDLYFLGFTTSYMSGRVYRATPDGVLQPFGTTQPAVTHMLQGAGAGSTRGFAVSRRTGETFVMYFDDQNRPAETTPAEAWDRCLPRPTAIAKFAPDGTCVDRHLVRYLRGGANGIRVDRAGGIYVGDNIMPSGLAYPAELAKVMPDQPLERVYPARLPDGSFDPLLRWMGCVLKFAPDGGRLTGMPEDANPPAVARAADDVYRPAPASQWFLHNSHQLTLTGAAWQFYGISPMPAQYQGVTHVEHCICGGGRFDLDPFDRVFVPDTIRHRFTVLDSAGNILCRFGQYGNRDSKGLALNSAGHIAAGDGYAFIGDGGARRLLRVKFTYAATAEAEVKR